MMKILVVEDDEFLINAYRVKFTNSGFEVSMARDGQEAINLLPSFQPDLILLDLVMPVKDGFTTLTEIKANPLYKNVPVIIATNLNQKEDHDKVMAAGAVDYIVKSDIKIEDLVSRIKAHLKSDVTTM